MLKVACIGGGHGLSVLLQGLRQLSGPGQNQSESEIDLSAIVCVSDNGGSSGHLRQSFGIPAVGDLRNCLVALSCGDPLLADLFQYRFAGGNGLQGHSLGNLIVTALLQMSGSLGQAVEMASEVLGSMGNVLPVTEAARVLCAELDSGAVIQGEAQITAARGRIKRVWMEPDSPPASTGVLEAISRADAVILGPGSLYTSIIPNLLVDGVAQAVRNSRALKIFVCNLTTQPGETGGYTATDHLKALETYLGRGVVDICLFNSRPINQTVEKIYLESESEPVQWEEEEIALRGVAPVLADLDAEGPLKVRHDPVKLARAIVTLAREMQRAEDTVLIPESRADHAEPLCAVLPAALAGEGQPVFSPAS
jgi:uncharacterized cofD-like protein